MFRRSAFDADIALGIADVEQMLRRPIPVGDMMEAPEPVNRASVPARGQER